jgi:hypothetical protein
MRIFDQISPVEIWTDATFPRAMLSSLLPNKRDFTRLTCWGVTMMRTGKNRLPLVQRLAVKVSELGRFGIKGSSWINPKPRGAALRRADEGTRRPYMTIPIPGRPFSRSRCIL